MPTPRAISTQELEAIKQSVLGAHIIALYNRMGVTRVHRRAAKDKRIPKWKVNQDELLAQLRWFEGRIPFMWSSPGVKGVIVDALDRNDHEFMMKLGRTLSRPAQHLNPAATKSEKLKQFLLDHWAEPRDGLPEFFYLTPEDAADLCSDRLHFAVDVANVKQLRFRLRLKSFPYKLYKVRWNPARTRILGVDKI